LRPAPDDDIRAADYVLGLMAPREAARFELDLRHNPDLAQRVQGWRERLAAMRGEAEPTPHAQMRQRIEDGMTGETEPRASPRPSKPRAVLPGRPAIAAIAFGCGLLCGAILVWFATM